MKPRTEPKSKPRASVLSALLLLALSPLAAAQAADGVKVGVIVSRSGAASTAGASQALAVSAWQATLRARGGVFGVPVEVEMADDASTAAQAAAAARVQIEGGAHAIVCCTTTAAARAVAPLAQAAGVILLSPAQLDTFGLDAVTPAAGAFSRWAFALGPSDTDALAGVVAHVLASGRGTLGLMTLDNEFGDRAETLLESLAGYAGMRLVDTVRYSPSERELRPEALLLASHQPGAIVVWGLREDLAVAVGALRRRGYEGPVYARSALLAPGAQPPAWGVLAGVRFAVSPSVVDDSLLPSQTCAADVAAHAGRLAGSFGGVADFGHAAAIVDALALLESALEQVVALQIPLERVEVVRQALRDGVVGLGPRCGASGLIDVLDDRESAVVPRGLVAAEVTPAGLVSVP